MTQRDAAPQASLDGADAPQPTVAGTSPGSASAPQPVMLAEAQPEEEAAAKSTVEVAERDEAFAVDAAAAVEAGSPSPLPETAEATLQDVGAPTEASAPPQEASPEDHQQQADLEDVPPPPKHTVEASAPARRSLQETQPQSRQLCPPSTQMCWQPQRQPPPPTPTAEVDVQPEPVILSTEGHPGTGGQTSGEAAAQEGDTT